MIRMTGPKPNRNVVHGFAPSSIGSALIFTPLVMSSASNPGSTNDGSVVANRVTGRGATRVVESPAGGYVTGAMKCPVMLSPRL